MQYRWLGRTGFEVSCVGFGAWAIGGSWGPSSEEESMAALHRALDLGINFFDTADVYGDGQSERLIARLRRDTRTPFRVATKIGRRSNPHVASAYSREILSGYVERCLSNLGVEALDLVQLHCPPTDVYYMPEVFEGLDALVKEGKVQFYGVSVERVEEALKAIEYENVQSIQIVFNLFRQRPAERFLAAAAEKRVGVIARLPLSSGLLTGKLSRATHFAPDDHRAFNRDGAAFDRGETFSGIDYEVGLSLVEDLRRLVPEGLSLVDLALSWILRHEAVTCAIPGARRSLHVEQNAKAADLPALPDAIFETIGRLYEGRIRPLVHHRW